jgi:hypothetical protein
MRHHQAWLLRLGIGARQQSQRLVITAMRPLRLKLHQGGEALAITIGRLALQNFMGFDLKLLQLRDRQIHPPAPRIVTYIADDVSQLHRQTQLVGILHRGSFLPAKNTCRDLAHHPGYQMAVVRQPGKINVARLVEVHLAAGDHLVQMLGTDAITGHMRHQSLHDRVAGLARKTARYLSAPPRQLGGRNTGV